VRRALTAGGAWFDMNGFSKLADSLLGSNDGADGRGPSEGPEQSSSPSVADDSSGAASGEPIGPVMAKSAKAADDVVGHDGVKRVEALRDGPPGEFPPGEKRAGGMKAAKASTEATKEARRRARFSAPIRVIESAPSNADSPVMANGASEGLQAEVGNDGAPPDALDAVTEVVPREEDVGWALAQSTDDPLETVYDEEQRDRPVEGSGTAGVTDEGDAPDGFGAW